MATIWEFGQGAGSLRSRFIVLGTVSRQSVAVRNFQPAGLVGRVRTFQQLAYGLIEAP